MSTPLPAIRPYELRALQRFVSKDSTRPHLATMWWYREIDGSGETYMATDGHALAVRRAGVHVSCSFEQIAGLPPKALSGDRSLSIRPPAWEHTITQDYKIQGQQPTVRGIDPARFALVTEVERAATRQRREVSPRPRRKRDLETLTAFSEWTIPADMDDPWRWSIPVIGMSARWDGLIMPRRIR